MTLLFIVVTLSDSTRRNVSSRALDGRFLPGSHANDHARRLSTVVGDAREHSIECARVWFGCERRLRNRDNDRDCGDSP